MITNADATLYTPDGSDGWRHVVLRGVNWQDNYRVTVRDRDLMGAAASFILIPYDVAGGIHGGDLLYRGVSDHASPPEGACTVVGVARCDYGDPAMFHWEVTVT